MSRTNESVALPLPLFPRDKIAQAREGGMLQRALSRHEQTPAKTNCKLLLQHALFEFERGRLKFEMQRDHSTVYSDRITIKTFRMYAKYVILASLLGKYLTNLKFSCINSQ